MVNDRLIIQCILFTLLVTIVSVIVCPDEFNRNLAALLVKIFIQRLPQWKHHAADNLGNEILLFGVFR